MKKFYFVLLSVSLAALMGCSKNAGEPDASDGGDITGTDTYVYMDVALQLPVNVGTRSATDWESEDNDPDKNPGQTPSDATPEDVELGQDYENTVKTALLVIAGVNGEYITHTEVTGILKGTADGIYSIKAKFKRDDLNKAYQQGGPLSGDIKRVRVYAYTNYTRRLHGFFSNITANGGINNNAWLDWAGEVEELPSRPGQAPQINNTIWAQHSFLMTNATEFTAAFPATADNWDDYTDEKNPYDIAETSGTISVERVAARIDFKDASANHDNIYNIVGGEDLNLIDVQLTRIALVNMSKNFYYLRRVSDGYGQPDKIGKFETSKNWVVDTDWTDKYNGTITPENAGNYFNFTLYGKKTEGSEHYPYDRASWYSDNIKDIVSGTSDNWNDKSYHIWRYVTENTLPSIESQNAVQSTGVIFKGLILPGKNVDASVNESDETTRYISKKVEKALIASKHHLPKSGDGSNNTSVNTPWNGDDENDITANMSYDYPTLYEFDGLLYAGFDEVVKRAVIDGQGGLLNAATQYILNHWVLQGTTFVHKADPETSDTKLTILIYNEIRNGAEHVDNGSTDYTSGYSIDMDESADYFKTYATTFNDPDASNFTLYEASYEDVETENGEGWGYYCYYFYWNRHNDNYLNGKMGQMEFATVRNNVYKLSVTKINRLGHPRNPDNDPDPYEPNNPDEESRIYLTVNLEVLPWVVRVNEIEF